MLNKIFNIKSLLDHLEEYTKAKIAVVKIDLKAELAAILIRLTLYMAIGSCLIIGLFFISFALAKAINGWLDHDYIGYLVSSLMYLLVGLAMFLMKKSRYLKNRLKNMVDCLLEGYKNI